MEGGEHDESLWKKENLNIVKEDVYRMNMEESNNFIESKYKVNFDDISSDEEEDEDKTSPEYVLSIFTT